MKLPFGRKKDVSAVPAEIQDYYQSERRERTGMAWLLALGTLLITVALAALLFFGGRWAYRALTNDNKQQISQTDSNEQTSVSEADDTTGDGSTETNDQPNTGTSSTSTSIPNSPANVNAPSVAGTSTALPSTGAGDIASLFVLTTAIGSTAHYAVTSRRTKS